MIEVHRELDTVLGKRTQNERGAVRVEKEATLGGVVPSVTKQAQLDRWRFRQGKRVEGGAGHECVCFTLGKAQRRASCLREYQWQWDQLDAPTTVGSCACGALRSTPQHPPLDLS